jgi:hypothetical protein
MVHGEKDAQRAFKLYLADRGYTNVEVVKYGATYGLE